MTRGYLTLKVLSALSDIDFKPATMKLQAPCIRPTTSLHSPSLLSSPVVSFFFVLVLSAIGCRWPLCCAQLQLTLGNYFSPSHLHCIPMQLSFPPLANNIQIASLSHLFWLQPHYPTNISIKWYWMSMCLDLAWNPKFLARAITPWLLESIFEIFATYASTLILVTWLRSKQTSLTALVRAIYWASMDDSATTDCFLLTQEMAPC